MKLESAGWIVAGGLAAATLTAFAVGNVSAAEAGSVWDGVYTQEQAERGGPLYTEKCAECHGPAMEGGEMSPALIGSQFLWDWNGLSVGDLFERLKVSMPDGKPRTMSSQDKADVLAYMLAKNNFPAGETEIPPRTESLTGIVFEATAPDTGSGDAAEEAGDPEAADSGSEQATSGP